MSRRPTRTQLVNAAIAAVAALCGVGARFTQAPAAPGPVLRAATSFASTSTAAYVARAAGLPDADAAGAHAAEVTTALGALSAAVRPLSHPEALQDAFRSYFAYRAEHPDAEANPYLYFVDYGLPSTEPRGYVFDMQALRVVDGPFEVAHGRGSSRGDGVPTRFSNALGSASTSLGLYVAQELYAFRGHANGRPYASTGLRLAGVSAGFNDLARARGVVAHGAPYVTPGRAGRSEGCPAMAPGRAERLLPKLAHGGLVFLFAPNPGWMARDPWLARADAALASR